MKSVLTCSGLAAGTLALVLASGCASEPGAQTDRSPRVDPPTGTHIVRRPATTAPTEQERDKAGEKAGQGTAPAQTRP